METLKQLQNLMVHLNFPTRFSSKLFMQKRLSKSYIQTWPQLCQKCKTTWLNSIQFRKTTFIIWVIFTMGAGWYSFLVLVFFYPLDLLGKRGSSEGVCVCVFLHNGLLCSIQWSQKWVLAGPLRGIVYLDQFPSTNGDGNHGWHTTGLHSTLAIQLVWELFISNRFVPVW